MKSALAAVAVVFACTTAAHSIDRAFDLVNYSDRDIRSVHIKHPNAPGWDNVLGRKLLKPGKSIRLEPYVVYGYCKFDIAVAFDNGTVQYLDRADLCSNKIIAVDGRTTVTDGASVHSDIL